MESLILVCVIVVLLFSLLVLILSRYKKCPSDKVMVIYGKVAATKMARPAARVVFTAAQPLSGRSFSLMSFWI